MSVSKSYNCVLLIETASNQRTIFHTNRERENIGASQLVHVVGTEFVTKALNQLGFKEHEHVRTVVSVSGKAIILTREDDKENPGKAREIVGAITERTLAECPGVMVRGAIAQIEKWSAAALDDAIARAHHRHADLAATLPSPAARFPALPFVQTCESSGYPAAAAHPDSQLLGGVSTPSLAKWRAGTDAWKRVAGALPGVELFQKMQEFAKRETDDKDIVDQDIDGNWVGIVHADGNGLGKVFLSFGEYLPDNLPSETEADAYITTLTTFSKEIDQWTKAAAKKAIEDTWPEKITGAPPRSPKKKRNRKAEANVALVPILPVVLGGDDLTVVCEGERAVRFAAAYLAAFEAESARWLAGEGKRLLPKLAEQGRVAAAAGVAIVKRNYPFYRAYELAEDLMRSAKTAKQRVFKTTNGKEEPVPCSALDFHVLFDASCSGLDPIRERMKAPPPSAERLTMRPYVVTAIADLAGAVKEGLEWAGRRLYRDACLSLHCAVEALLKSPERGDEADTAHLPRSQAHALHDALYQGPDIANARMRQIVHRYEKFPWGAVAPEGSLFVKDATKDDPNGKGAYLLDAMELADIGKEHALDNSGKRRGQGQNPGAAPQSPSGPPVESGAAPPGHDGKASNTGGAQ